MNREVVPYVLLTGIAIADRFLKMLVEQPAFLFQSRGWSYLAFERFHNFGVAFNIPIPRILIIFTTLVCMVWVWRLVNRSPHFRVYAVAITLGAISNFTDRIFYGYTIDYLRILYSIINIADLLVIWGVFMLLRKK